MPSIREEWAAAYAKQSKSDYLVYEEIISASPEVEECHRLHYLQMACEKIAKAYRFRDTETSIEDLTTEHVAFSKFIENFLGCAEIKARWRGQEEKLSQIRRLARLLAREIEKLAPAVDRERSPQNAEYPWADGERIIVPCEYSYPNVSLLKEVVGRNFLKLIKIAILDFDKIRIA